MDDVDELAQQFEGQRAHLRAVAFRMLGSLTEADDAVQETWLRLARSDTSAVQNLAGWLTTVLSRVCLDMLRSAAARSEEPGGLQPPAPGGVSHHDSDPEYRALRAESVGSALLVVLDKLAPAERVAFVLHDLFAVPFEEIGPIVDRSPATAKKLASRARARVKGTPAVSRAELTRHRRVVEAFLAAMRGGDIKTLLGLLDPDVVRRADRAVVPEGGAAELHGTAAVVDDVRSYARRARFAEPALVDGTVGLVVVAPRGQLLLAIRLAVKHEKITEIEVIGEPHQLRRLDLATLD